MDTRTKKQQKALAIIAAKTLHHHFPDRDFAEITVDENGMIHAKLKASAERVNIAVKFLLAKEK